MTREEEIAKIMRAAADGYIERYRGYPTAGTFLGMGGGGGGNTTSPSYSASEIATAEAVAGALRAIAKVYEDAAKEAKV